MLKINKYYKRNLILGSFRYTRLNTAIGAKSTIDWKNDTGDKTSSFRRGEEEDRA